MPELTQNPLELLAGRLSNGSDKQRLIAQMLLQQQQQQQTEPERPATDKYRERLRRMGEHNRALKKKLVALKRDRHKLLEYLEYLLDKNEAFAAAVGACECWGEDEECQRCRGRGRAGWTVVAPEAYAEYVAPAAAPVQPPTQNNE